MAKGYEVTAPVLNIRSGPGTQYQDIGDLRRGDILVAPVGWVPVLMDDDSIGWVSAEFVKEVELEEEAQAAPLAFVPMMNLRKLDDPSIIDAF